MTSILKRIESLVDKVEDWSRLPAEPLVSVWMITFNQECYIRQAIDSMLMQEVAFPYEIVIGEDKSTDRTREILSEYQRKNAEKIRLRLARENLYSQRLKPGIGVLHACRGKYIAMLEGDDYWTDRQKLRKQVAFLEAHPDCSLCFHDVRVEYTDASRPPHSYKKGRVRPISTLADIAEGNYIATGSVLFRRSMLPSLPDWFWRVPVADWCIFCLLAERGSIGFLDETMGVFRRNPQSVWSMRSDWFRTRGASRTARVLDRHFRYRFRREFGSARYTLWSKLAVASAQSGLRRPARLAALLALMCWPLASSPVVSRRQLAEVLVRGSLSSRDSGSR